MEKKINKTVEAQIKIKFWDQKDGYNTANMSIEASNRGHILKSDSGSRSYSRIVVTTEDMREIAKKLVEAADEIDADPDFKII